MSRDNGDLDPPRRPRPSRKPPEPDRQNEQPTTWRPNPAKPAKSSSTRTPGGDASAKPAPGGPSWGERLFFGRIGSAQLGAYCRQFGAYLDAGVDIRKALASLEKQYTHTALGPVTGRLLSSVRQGTSLSESVAAEPQAFDTLFVSMMRVAEARGGVPETLSRMARHYESRANLIRQARSAMIYPVIVLIVASAVVTLITVFILPKFVDMLKGLSGNATTLPFASRALMSFSAFIGWVGWWILPMTAIGLPFALFSIYKTQAGKSLMDEVALYVPVLGMLLRKIDTTRFARTLSTLLASGVDVGTSLELTGDVLHLAPYRKALRSVRRDVVNGDEIGVAMTSTRRFTPDVLAIVNSGEETGKLPESLDRLADSYEEQVTYMVRNLGQLVQPMLIIMLGGIVLFIVLAVLMPLIQTITTLAG